MQHHASRGEWQGCQRSARRTFLLCRIGHFRFAATPTLCADTVRRQCECLRDISLLGLAMRAKHKARRRGPAVVCGFRGPTLFRYRAGSVPVPQTDFIGENSKEIALIDDVDTRVPSHGQFARRFFSHHDDSHAPSTQLCSSPQFQPPLIPP